MKTAIGKTNVRRRKYILRVLAIIIIQAFAILTFASARKSIHGFPDSVIYKKAYTTEEIQKEYSGIFKIALQSTGKNECIYFPNGINLDLPLEHFLFDYIFKYHAYLAYLQSHYTTLGNYIEFNSYFQKFECKELDVRYNYYDLLKADKNFNQYFLTLLADFFEVHGSQITGFTPLPRTQITIDSLMTVASGLFDIGIMENGEMEWLFAIWQNPYKNATGSIKGSNAPLFAGFCYFAMHSDKVKIRNDILARKKIIEKKARSWLTSTGGIERYTFFHNELQLLMQHSEVLKSILIKHYEENKDVLNFELIYQP